VYREGIARGVRATVLRPVLALQQGTVERAARFNDPSRLRAERDSLAAYLVGQAAVDAENRQLRSLLGLRERLPSSFVPAQVIWLPGRAVEGFFQLTAGTDHGVRPGAAIVSAEGLVGRVRSADRGISFGIAWMNPEFRASAMTADNATYGIVEPRRGPGGEWMLALTGTPRHVRLENGAILVTSGHGGVFPTGIPIGSVAGVEGAETSWQRTYLIRPMVSPSEMEYVLVLGGPREGLSGQNLATTWGIRMQQPATDTAAARAAEEAAQAAMRAAERERQRQAAPQAPRETGPPILGVPVTRDTSGTPE
jgi:rod shape-determining protein MreC